MVKKLSCLDITGLFKIDCHTSAKRHSISPHRGHFILGSFCFARFGQGFSVYLSIGIQWQGHPAG